MACLAFALVAGCTKAPEPVAAPVVVAEQKDVPPGIVELVSSKALMTDDNIVRFEVAYRFTSGAPVKHYLCEITFPGTANHGLKPMDAWEVKPEGVIKTGIQLADVSAKDYVVTFAEADSPDRGYKVISNTLTGVIESAPN